MTTGKRRTYVGELEWALGQIRLQFHDRNPHRQARVTAALDYGLAVAIARRSHEPLPDRPNMERIV